MLGDGRAILLGEQITPSGDRVDIQLKGAGPTRFSRRGDGRAALGPMLREYIISEAMHALGIPTTRSLAVVTTGEPVYREARAAGRGAHARGRQPHPRRHVRVRGGARRRSDRCGRWPTTRIAPPLPGAGRCAASSTCALFRSGHRAAGRADRAVAARRLRPRRDEHRQHGALRRDDRLRPVRVHGRLRPGHGVQLHRPRAAATPTATSRAIAQWNLARLRRGPAAAARRGRRNGRSRGATEALDGFPAAVRAALARRHASEARAVHARRPDDAALIDGPARLDAATSGRLHEHLPVADRRACRHESPTPIRNWPRWHRRWQARRGRQPQTAAESTP